MWNFAIYSHFQNNAWESKETGKKNLTNQTQSAGVEIGILRLN